MVSGTERSDLSESNLVKRFLNYQRRRRQDLREVLNAILYITRTGIQWRNLKETNFPDWQAVYYYFYQWSKNHVLEKINQSLNRAYRKKVKRSKKPSILILDAQSIKLAPMIYEFRGVDAHKKVNGRKRQILVDTTGRIYAFQVHAANVHDVQDALDLVQEIEQHKKVQKIYADKAYRGLFEEHLGQIGCNLYIPKRAPDQKGFIPEEKLLSF